MQANENEPSFPMPRECPYHPPAPLAGFQETDGPKPVRLWNGDTALVFTRYDDVRAILADNRFSTDPSRPGFPKLSPARGSVLEAPPTFIRMDPPEHGKYRRMLTREFMIKRIEEMRPQVQARVDALIDRMESRGGLRSW